MSRKPLSTKENRSAELDAIGREIAAANLDCERASPAADELARLLAAAEARENQEQIELQAAEAQQQAQQLIKSYAEIDLLVDAMKARLEEASAGKQRCLVPLLPNSSPSNKKINVSESRGLLRSTPKKIMLPSRSATSKLRSPEA